MTEQWFSYAEFKFSREQVVWALEHLEMLRKGQWPPEHKVTGYIGGKGKKQSKRAPFENPAGIAAELDFRLCQVGCDGLFLEMVYSQPDDKLFVMQHIAQALKVDINEISRDIERALKFVCGYRRKSRSFSQWKNHRGKVKDNV